MLFISSYAVPVGRLMPLINIFSNEIGYSRQSYPAILNAANLANCTAIAGVTQKDAILINLSPEGHTDRTISLFPSPIRDSTHRFWVVNAVSKGISIKDSKDLYLDWMLRTLFEQKEDEWNISVISSVFSLKSYLFLDASDIIEKIIASGLKAVYRQDNQVMIKPEEVLGL